MPDDPVAPLVPDFSRYRTEPGERVRLADYDTADTDDMDSDEAHAELAGLVERIADLQARLYAEERRSVLVVRVKNLAPEELWRSRYDSINDFERMLVREGTTIVKFFLHISPEAQLDRFRERLEREDKHYKFSVNDVRERRHWDAYQQAYEDALQLTSTTWAPWYVVPSDHKWFRNLVVARIVAGTLAALDPQWPEPDEELEGYALEELASERSSR